MPRSARSRAHIGAMGPAAGQLDQPARERRAGAASAGARGRDRLPSSPEPPIVSGRGPAERAAAAGEAGRSGAPPSATKSPVANSASSATAGKRDEARTSADGTCRRPMPGRAPAPAAVGSCSRHPADRGPPAPAQPSRRRRRTVRARGNSPGSGRAGRSACAAAASGKATVSAIGSPAPRDPVPGAAATVPAAPGLRVVRAFRRHSGRSAVDQPKCRWVAGPISSADRAGVDQTSRDRARSSAEAA